MRQQGQVFELKSTRATGQPTWAYRYRLDVRDSRRVQRGGFPSERDAREALERELQALRRKRRGHSLTLNDVVDEYLDQHDAQPETTAKLRGCSPRPPPNSERCGWPTWSRARSPHGG